jgi:hypothetical protein
MEARQKKEVATLLAAELRRAQLEEQHSILVAKKNSRIEEEAALRDQKRRDWEAMNVRTCCVSVCLCVCLSVFVRLL